MKISMRMVDLDYNDDIANVIFEKVRKRPYKNPRIASIYAGIVVGMFEEKVYKIVSKRVKELRWQSTADIVYYEEKARIPDAGYETTLIFHVMVVDKKTKAIYRHYIGSSSVIIN